MRSKLALLAAAVLVIALIVIRMAAAPPALEAPGERPDARPSEGQAHPQPDPDPGSDIPGQLATHARQSAEEPSPPAPTEQGPARIAVRGTAFDQSGEVAPGLELKLVPPFRGLERVTSGLDGRLAMDLEVQEDEHPHRKSSFFPMDEKLLTLFDTGISTYRIEREYEILVAVAPARSLSGMVVDEAGVGIADAEVKLELPSRFRSRFASTLEGAKDREWKVSTGPGGAFVLARAPDVGGCALIADAMGFERGRLDPVPTNGGPFEITLLRQDDLGRIRGTVLDLDGQPVEKANVGLGTLVQRTGADGRFEFRTDSEETQNGPQRIVATAQNYLPAEYAPAAAPGGGTEWPAEITLRLTEPSLSITGHVLTPGGQPVAGAEVWAEDPTVIGVINEYSPVLAEVVMGGSGRLRNAVTTDDSGAFTMNGLRDRTYDLTAMDTQSLATAEPAIATQAGAESVTLRLADPGDVVLSGVVVSGSGEPIQGATVTVERTVAYLSVPGKGGANIDSAKGRSWETGADGRFELDGVSAQAKVNVLVTAHKRQPLKQELSTLATNLTELRLTLFSRCDVRLEANPPSPDMAGYMYFLDAAGERLKMTEYPDPSSMVSYDIMSISAGKSSTVEVSDGAVQVELHIRGRDVEIRPIQLRPGKVNIIDL